MAPQNPKYPDKIYSGLSVEDYIRQFGQTLTESQKQTLRKMREQGKLY